MLQRRAHGTQTPVDCVYDMLSGWWKQCLYQIIRRFISTVMLATNSLGSWRICISIFLASSGTPSSCGRLVIASSPWEILRWLTLGSVSSSIEIPLSLSEPYWEGATLAEPKLRQDSRTTVLEKNSNTTLCLRSHACGSGLFSSICFVNFFWCFLWWWPLAAPV